MAFYDTKPRFGNKKDKKGGPGGAAADKKKRKMPVQRTRFRDRGGDDWVGPIVDYKELEVLRKCMTSSGKIMSRKRAGTNAREQRDIRRAIKHARYIGLLPFTGA